jgi:hypothetical protein
MVLCGLIFEFSFGLPIGQSILGSALLESRQMAAIYGSIVIVLLGLSISLSTLSGVWQIDKGDMTMTSENAG